MCSGRDRSDYHRNKFSGKAFMDLHRSETGCKFHSCTFQQIYQFKFVILPKNKM